jgi:hypothetical protein
MNEYTQTPDQDTMAQIQHYASALEAINEDIEKLEASIKNQNANKRKIQEEVLPDLMMSVNMQSFKLDNGSSVSLNKFYDARLVDREACFAFLRDSGNDGIIKNTIKTEFGKGEESEADKLEEILGQNSIAYQRKADVHHMTLKSFVKDACESGMDFPKEAFGVYEGNRVTIKQ